jgi:hypothetical protein
MYRFKAGLAVSKKGLALGKKGAFLFVQGLGVSSGFLSAENMNPEIGEQPVDSDNVSYKDVRTSKISDFKNCSNGQEEENFSGNSEQSDEKSKGEERSEGGQNSNKFKYFDQGVGAAGVALGLFGLHAAAESTKQLEDIAKQIENLDDKVTDVGEEVKVIHSEIDAVKEDIKYEGESTRNEVAAVKEDVKHEGESTRIMVMDESQNKFEDEWMLKLDAPVTFGNDDQMSFKLGPYTFHEQDALFKAYVERLSEEERASLSECRYRLSDPTDVKEYLEYKRLLGELPKIQ